MNSFVFFGLFCGFFNDDDDDYNDDDNNNNNFFKFIYRIDSFKKYIWFPERDNIFNA